MEDDSEIALIEANQKLLTRGDDSIVSCEAHGIQRRWGDLSPVTQLAILAGLDVHGERCIMDE